MLPRVTRVMSQNAGCFFVKCVKHISLESWIPHLWHRCGRVNHRLLKCCSGATAALCQLGKVWQSAADLRDQPWCNATIQRPGRAVSGSLWIKNAIHHLLCHTTWHDRHARDCLCQTQVFFCKTLEKTMWRSFPPQREMPQQRVEGVNLPLSRQEILPKTSQPKSLNLP